MSFPTAMLCSLILLVLIASLQALILPRYSHIVLTIVSQSASILTITLTHKHPFYVFQNIIITCVVPYYICLDCCHPHTFVGVETQCKYNYSLGDEHLCLIRPCSASIQNSRFKDHLNYYLYHLISHISYAIKWYMYRNVSNCAPS